MAIMKFFSLVTVMVLIFGGTVHAAPKLGTPQITDSTAKDAAKAITLVTGIAISPLLGVSAVGAYDWFAAKTPEEKAALPWYAHIAFWLPALLIVGAVAAKDAFGTTLPPGLKKPLDVIETVENKVSGLVAAGAVVPSIAAFFAGHGGTHALLGHGLNTLGFAAIDFSPVLNILMIPLFVAAYAVVWLVGHVINVLILLSPFGVVDAALKSVRTALMGALVIIHHINPWVGAALSLVIIVISYFLAGWSFRLMVFGAVYIWDFLTGRRHRFQPAANANWMFTGRKVEQTPVRTYGRLVKTDEGQLTFAYRPWLFGAPRTVVLPGGIYAVGRGLFYPELMLVEGGKTKTMLVLPPRYKSHEEAIARIYGVSGVRDVGILKGFKALWRWLKGLFGFGSAPATVPA
jgi:hypothetical protein